MMGRPGQTWLTAHDGKMNFFFYRFLFFFSAYVCAYVFYFNVRSPSGWFKRDFSEIGLRPRIIFRDIPQPRCNRCNLVDSFVILARIHFFFFLFFTLTAQWKREMSRIRVHSQRTNLNCRWEIRAGAGGQRVQDPHEADDKLRQPVRLWHVQVRLEELAGRQRRQH